MTSFVPSKILILLVAACLVWVGIISLAVAVFSGSVSSGWVVAGAIVLAVMAWVLVMAREIRGAVTVPDSSAVGERHEGEYDIEGASTVSRPRANESRIFLGRRIMAIGRHFKSQPRKRRSKWQEPLAEVPAPR
jgi:membrane protein implicated in regulation of membrane protease activity